MHYTVSMTVCDSREYLLYYHGSIMLTELCLGGDLIEQLSPSAQLGNDVVPLRVLVELVQSQNVWMILITPTTVRLSSSSLQEF